MSDVLVVDDEAGFRRMVRRWIEREGVEVTEAESAEQALERLRSNGIDLVISDVVMPGMSGVELAERIREMRPDVPVLLATGYSDEIVKRGSDFSVLAKPFGAASLSEAMAALLIESEAKPSPSAVSRG